MNQHTQAIRQIMQELTGAKARNGEPLAAQALANAAEAHLQEVEKLLQPEQADDTKSMTTQAASENG